MKWCAVQWLQVGARSALALGAATALLTIAPSAALAKGWKLELRNKIGTASSKTTAKHCGKTKFGTWSFRVTIAAEGTVALLRWKTVITTDGALHPTTDVRATGSAPASARTSLKQTFASVKFRYVAGSPPKLKTQQPDGSTFSTLTFRPTPTRRC